MSIQLKFNSLYFSREGYFNFYSKIPTNNKESRNMNFFQVRFYFIYTKPFVMEIELLIALVISSHPPLSSDACRPSREKHMELRSERHRVQHREQRKVQHRDNEQP